MPGVNFVQQEESSCTGTYMCALIFVSAPSNHEATATFDLRLAVVFSVVCFCKL